MIADLDAARAQQVAASISDSFGPSAASIGCDVSKGDQVQAAVQSAYLQLLSTLNFDSDRLGFDCDCVVLESRHLDAKVVQEVVVTVDAYTDRHRSCLPERDLELDVGHDEEVSAAKGLAIPEAWAHRDSYKLAVEAMFLDSNTILCSNESHPSLV
jgi:hypothetical protein